MNCEKQVRTTIRNRENNNKKKEILAEIWATFRWVTEYLTLTTQEWEIKKEEQEQEVKIRLENWNKLLRTQKIVQYKLENEPIEQKKQQQNFNQKTTKLQPKSKKLPQYLRTSKNNSKLMSTNPTRT